MSRLWRVTEIVDRRVDLCKARVRPWSSKKRSGRLERRLGWTQTLEVTRSLGKSKVPTSEFIQKELGDEEDHSDFLSFKIQISSELPVWIEALSRTNASSAWDIDLIPPNIVRLPR